MVKEINSVYDLLRSKREDLEFDKGSVLPEEIAAVTEHRESLPSGMPKVLAMHEVAEAQYVPKQGFKATPKTSVKTDRFLKKDYVKYPLIFVLSFGFFYVALNFGAFYSKLQGMLASQAPEPETEGQVLGVATPEYMGWIGKYFFYVNNQDALSPNLDYDKDGLTNYQEYLLGSNPTKIDTDNDNYSDGQEILNGYNPLYEGKLTEKQLELIKDWDLRSVNNRVSYNVVSTLAQGPAKPSNLPQINYNLTQEGEVHIPKLGVRAPIIWSRTPDSFEDDLDRGLVHFPGTSLPGQAGVAYISGHSSNFAWRQSAYSYVFTRINELEAGDEFFVTIPRADGESMTLRYVVFAEARYKPDDQAQFNSEGDESIVNLSTCWPIGSIAERYVVSARLTGV